MRIAFPVSDGDGLNVEFFEHIGYASHYLIIGLSKRKVKDFSVIEDLYSEAYGPGVAPRLLADHDVDVLICRGMDRRAAEYFESSEIKVTGGAYGHVGEVIGIYLNGLLDSKDYKPEEKRGWT